MIDLVEVARREVGRIVAGSASVAPHSLACGGGVLCRGAPGLWINCGYGVGLGSANGGELKEPEARELARAIVQYYQPHGIEPRVELSPFTARTLLTALEAEGFGLRGFETCFFRELAPAEVIVPPRGTPEGLVIEEVAKDDDAAAEEHARTAQAGFTGPDVMITDEMIDLGVSIVRHPLTVAVIARLDGRAVGAGSMEVRHGVAGLFGLSVLPHARQRGVQSALIAFRLNAAIRRGATLATIGATPGISTERNARRFGFQVAYTNVTMAKAGPGLAAVCC